MRISPTLIKTAGKESHLLKLLVPACRTLEASRRELSWIQNELPRAEWHGACVLRSRHVPLQYILGTQPFGELTINCHRNVLIPRWETEEWCSKLVGLLQPLSSSLKSPLNILDVCTGTGCIPLLMGHSLPEATVRGVDISKHALELATENSRTNRVSNADFEFMDMFKPSWLKGQTYDLVVSNPPYISQKDLNSSATELSVRLYEPKLALLGGEENYRALIQNFVIPLEAEGFAFEIGSRDQGLFITSLLDEQWDTKVINDSAGKPRCAVGWKKGTKLQVLEHM